MQTSEAPSPSTRGEITGNAVNQSLPVQLWLKWLSEMLPGHRRLHQFHLSSSNTIQLQASHPGSGATSENELSTVLSAMRKRVSVYTPCEDQSNTVMLAVPLITAEQRLHGVFVLHGEPMTPIQQRTATKLVQWASHQLFHPHAMGDGDSNSAGPESRLSQTMLSSLASHGTLTALAFSLSNTMASLCGCTRVSVGRYDSDGLRLIAMSGQSKIDDRRQIASQLRAVMSEVIEGDRIVYPNPDDAKVPIATQAYYETQGKLPVLAFSLDTPSSIKFVLVLERDNGQHFLPAQIDAIEHSVRNVGALLVQTSKQEQGTAKKLKALFAEKKRALMQVTNWTSRQLCLALACFALLMSFIIPVTHRVSADAHIEASDRQVMVASQSGFIQSANARAGDLVTEGELLATLDVEDLTLEVDKWRSEKTKNQQAYAQALATHDRTELSRLRADANRIEAEIALLEQRLERSEVRAPISGVLMAGDWTQSLGAPVTAGDVLFEIASAEKYQLIIEVDEHDIAHVHPRQRSELRMTALPATVWQAELGDVLPVAVSEQGKSTFRVLANIDGDTSALRPGMQGVGKIHIGKRSMFWVYSHKLGERIRYLAWKLGLL